ncbi:hypothetical protein [Blastococcus jejuensis]|uniref:hypothetical protein n=1 Tax=Blastococcus jejuensis TaxID=351224 RepID=UPI0031D5A7B1
MAEPVTVPPTAAPPSPVRARIAPAAVLSVTLLGTNALAYVFTMLAARLLAPAAYGELAALMGVLLVGVVPATGLQTAAALHLGARRGAAGALREADVRALHTTALLAALAVGALGIAATAPIVHLLHLPEPAAVGWLVALLVPHTVVGGYDGVLQGSGRYGRLAVVTACFGAAKLVGGTAGLVLGGSPTTALAGMALGATAGALLGWTLCGRPGLARGVAAPARAALRASGALLGFVLLLNLDVLLARHHLPGPLAGEYAVAAIFAKVAFWLPQGIGVVLLPRLADAEHRRRRLARALAVVAAAGALLTLATAALGPHALPLVGGEAYGEALGSASWLFAALGTLLALAQLLLYSGIAAADRAAVLLVWTAAGAEVVVVGALAAAGHLAVLTPVLVAGALAALVVVVGLVRLGLLGRSPGRGL